MLQFKANIFEERRRRLGISCAELARKTGVSLRTVQRVLSGQEKDPGFATVSAIAQALKVSVEFVAEDADDVRRRRAQEKAAQLLSLVQGSSALEVQAVPEAAIKSLTERTVHELLAGSNRKLWAD